MSLKVSLNKAEGRESPWGSHILSGLSMPTLPLTCQTNPDMVFFKPTGGELFQLLTYPSLNHSKGTYQVDNDAPSPNRLQNGQKWPQVPKWIGTW